jgi:serine/threonine-protein kinase
VNAAPGSDDLARRVSEALADSYDFERELEGGGMSRVFVATDKRLARKVVVKVLPPEMAAGVSGERFRREILTIARLQHPHIVTVLETGEVDGLPFFVMPFVEGESLALRISRKGKLGVRETVAIMKDVARALAFAHERGVIHRDIKPGNILLSSGSATVTDFGVAKAIVSSRYGADAAQPLTNSGISLGTLLYMAPEQIAGDPDTDGRADLYSLGVTVYEALTGAPPFAELGPRGMLAARLSRDPIPLSATRLDVPPALEKLLMRCMATDPAGRPTSASELVDELEDPTLLAGAPVASGESTANGKWKLRRHHALYAIAAAVIFVIAGMLLTRKSEGSADVRAVSANNTGAPAGMVVAVLPFVGLGADSSDGYMATGLTNSVAGKLTRVTGMRVIAPSRAVAYASGNPRDAAKNTLRAAFVLEGTVERQGNKVRVTASLTSTDTGVMQWADVFDGSTSDIFVVEDKIASEIVRAVTPGPAAAGTAVKREVARPL